VNGWLVCLFVFLKKEKEKVIKREQTNCWWNPCQEIAQQAARLLSSLASAHAHITRGALASPLCFVSL
jgi:hypothetical protein